MQHPLRSAFLFALAVCLGPCAEGGDKKNKPYSELPIVKKQYPEETTQALPPAKEPPGAVTAETSTLLFSTLPLSPKGLLSQQTREAIRLLLRNNRAYTVVKLRAFVAGSGDVRRVQEIVSDMFGEKRQTLPALTVVQVGALPLEGAQISIEAIIAGKKESNPYGLGFFSAQSGPSLGEASSKLRDALSKAGLEASDAVRVTCYVNSFDAAGNPRGPLSAFSSAAVTVVQMLREPVGPSAACEAVAQLRAPAEPPVKFLAGQDGQAVAVLVSVPSIALTGLQMAFGREKEDIRQGYDRLNKALASVHASFADIVATDTYLLFGSVAQAAAEVRTEFSGHASPPASMTLPFEGLPSLDATLGIEAVAVPHS